MRGSPKISLLTELEQGGGAGKGGLNL